MIYLILAILSSALVSLLMRLSSDRVTGNISMLAMNYLMCFVISVGYTGIDSLFFRHPALTQTIAMGGIHGFLYLLSFVLLQRNVKKNGVVLSSVFMKLGLLVPMLLSVCVFGERPAAAQVIGFVVAVAAIVLINVGDGASTGTFRAGLILLLLSGGCADAMSKVFEEVGCTELSAQFLLYTFMTAGLMCMLWMLHIRQKPGKNELLFGLAIGIPNFFSAKLLLRALESMPAVVVYPTYSVATILVVTTVGVLAFGERLRRRQWLAVGAILTALVMLNV